eukprot:3940331-Rhodomonas_salina.1
MKNETVHATALKDLQARSTIQPHEAVYARSVPGFAEHARRLIAPYAGIGQYQRSRRTHVRSYATLRVGDSGNHLALGIVSDSSGCLVPPYAVSVPDIA